jgi:hypothetical protein
MKMLVVGLAIAAAAVGGGLGYAGMQTSTLPDWYSQVATSENVSSPDSGGAFPEGYEVGTSATYETGGQQDPSPRTAGEDVLGVISADKLNDMVTDAIASQPYTAPILDVAKGINTSIKNGRIESGVVMNLADLPMAALPAQGQQAIAQLTETFPFLANRDVYLGVEGSPKVVDGALSLDDTNIKIGQLKLPVASVANQLGLSQADIEQQIGALLNQQGLTLNDVQIIDGQLVIKGQ